MACPSKPRCCGVEADYLGDDHLAVFLLDVLPALDLQPILGAYAEDQGQPPYGRLSGGAGRIWPSCT